MIDIADIFRKHFPDYQQTTKLPLSTYKSITIPAALNPLVLRNKKILYSILFKASSETLLTLAKDEKYLGAQIGFISVLHT